jgi:hypothetical protein
VKPAGPTQQQQQLLVVLAHQQMSAWQISLTSSQHSQELQRC